MNIPPNSTLAQYNLNIEMDDEIINKDHACHVIILFNAWSKGTPTLK